MADTSPPDHTPGAAPHDDHGPFGFVGVQLERARYVVAVGAVTALVLALGSFAWGVWKTILFVKSLVAGEDDTSALLKLFQAVDVILIGTVLLVISMGLWELFIGDMDLPEALSVRSFDELKVKIATTLLLVLVVRFLEVFGTAQPTDVLQLAGAVTLVGGLLLIYAKWRGTGSH